MLDRSSTCVYIAGFMYLYDNYKVIKVSMSREAGDLSRNIAAERNSPRYGTTAASDDTGVSQHRTDQFVHHSGSGGLILNCTLNHLHKVLYRLAVATWLWENLYLNCNARWSKRKKNLMATLSVKDFLILNAIMFSLYRWDVTWKETLVLCIKH